MNKINNFFDTASKSRDSQDRTCFKWGIEPLMICIHFYVSNHI